MKSSKDFVLVSIIGVGFGLLLIPIFQNIQPAFWQLTLVNAVGLAVSFGLFANFSLYVASLLSHSWPAIWQFAKYAAVGSFNSLLDLGILNFLSHIFQVYRGPTLILFNTISFLISVSNSYFWNKFWSFKSSTPLGWLEYVKFVLATLGGLIINNILVYFITLSTPEGFSLPVWENVAKLIAVPPTLLWNFFSYRLFIFKHNIK